MFVAKYSLPGKNNFDPTQLQWQTYFGVAEKSFKNSTTTPNPLPMKITQTTELSEEYWEIKRNNFIPKVTWDIVRECPPYNLSKRKCCLCLN